MIGALSAAGHDTRDLRPLFRFKQIKIDWHLRHYWEEKVLSGGQFHPLEHGGARVVKFGPELKRLLKYEHFPLFVMQRTLPCCFCTLSPA